jgi:hypothetical protein
VADVSLPNTIAPPTVSTSEVQGNDEALRDYVNSSGWVNSARIADGTIVAGDVADGTLTNAKLASGFFPAARVYASGTQSLTTATYTALTFDSERFDNASIHSTVTNPTRLTIPTTGVYLVSANVGIAAGAGSVREVWFRVGGSTYISGDVRANQSGKSMQFAVSTIWQFTAAQYVEVVAMQESGGSLPTVQSASSSPEFSIAMLTP